MIDGLASENSSHVWFLRSRACKMTGAVQYTGLEWCPEFTSHGVSQKAPQLTGNGEVGMVWDGSRV